MPFGLNRADLLISVALPLIAAFLALVFGVALPRFRRRRKLRGPIAVPLFKGDDLVPPRPRRTPAPATQAVVATQQESPGTVAKPRAQVATGTGTDGLMQVDARAAVDAAPHLRLEPTLPDHAAVRTEARPAVRKTQRVVDGTLQFLPGRLEVIEGRDVGQEIRFVRQPGDEVAAVTFGRSDGPQYRHVQLHEPTVSRLHAKMSYDGKRWRLTNMSTTNPVVVNGAPLDGEGTSQVLSEGDRVEMGEVAFRFRGR